MVKQQQDYSTFQFHSKHNPSSNIHRTFLLKLLNKLGRVVVLETSKKNPIQIDLFGNRLGNYCIIFGKHITWEEIRWHINECKRLGIINREFAEIRKFGSITIRVNAKNDRIPAPKVIYAKYGNDDVAIKRFLEFLELCKDVGFKKESSYKTNKTSKKEAWLLRFLF